LSHQETRISAGQPRAQPEPTSDLEPFLAPASVAIVGASRRQGSLSGRLAPVLRQHGYQGKVFLVNPSAEPIDGQPSYPSVLALPEAADVALVSVAAAQVPAVLEQCGQRGIRCAIVLSSGFAERLDNIGTDLQREVDDVRRRYSLRVLGPNCEGLLSVSARAPLTFSPTVDLDRALRRLPQPGGVAVISQSGGLGFALFHDGSERGLQFSHVVTTGNECDLDLTDALEAVVAQEPTRGVLAFVEGVRDLDRFVAAVRKAEEAGTGVAVVKIGRSPAGARAALAHTAHEAGDSAYFEEAVTAAGAHLAEDQEDLVDLGLGFAHLPRWRSGGVGVIAISGGAGAWAADACFAYGLEVPLLSEQVRERLAGLIPPYGSPANPVDLTATALATGGLVAPLEVLAGLDEIGAIVVAGSFGGPEQLRIEGEALRQTVSAQAKPVVVYSYTRPGPESVDLLREAGLAWFPSARRAARVLAARRAP
jgi:acyl-CoA synthetase (NDP forming)